MQQHRQCEEFLSSKPILNAQIQQHTAQIAAAQLQANSNLQTQQLLQMHNPQTLHQMFHQPLYASNRRAAQHLENAVSPGAYSHYIGNTAASPLSTVKVAPDSLGALVVRKKGRFSVFALTDDSSSPTIPKTSVGAVRKVPTPPTPHTSDNATLSSRTLDPNQQNGFLDCKEPSDNFSYVYMGGRQAQTSNRDPPLPTISQIGVGGQGNLSLLTSALVTQQVVNPNFSSQPVLNTNQNLFSPAQNQQIQRQLIPSAMCFHQSHTSTAMMQQRGTVHQTLLVSPPSHSVLGVSNLGGSISTNAPSASLPQPITTKKGRFILTSTHFGDVGSQTCPPQGNILGYGQALGGSVHSGRYSTLMESLAHADPSCMTRASPDTLQLQRACSMPSQHQEISTDPRVATGIHQLRPPSYVPNRSYSPATVAPEVHVATRGELQLHSHGSGGITQPHLSAPAFSVHRAGSLALSARKLSVLSGDAPSSTKNMFHYLEQLELELTDIDRAMTCLQKDIKLLRSKNKELETRCNELQGQHAEEKVLREAAESKVRVMKKRVKELKNIALCNAPSNTVATLFADGTIVGDVANGAPVTVEDRTSKFSMSLVKSNSSLSEQPDAKTVLSFQFLLSGKDSSFSKHDNDIIAKSLFAKNNPHSSGREVADLQKGASPCQSQAPSEHTMAKVNSHNNSTAQFFSPSNVMHANISGSKVGASAIHRSIPIF